MHNMHTRVHTLLVVYILLARVSTLRRSTIDRFSASIRFRYDLQRHNTLASSSSSTRVVCILQSPLVVREMKRLTINCMHTRISH